MTFKTKGKLKPIFAPQFGMQGIIGQLTRIIYQP